jgi:hypothetical protein
MNDGAMSREAQLDFFGLRAAAHLNRLPLDLHRLPLITSFVLPRIAGLGFFDIQISLVSANNRESPGDALIVTDGNAGQCRFAAADGIPAGSVQVHEIAEGRQGDRAVRVVGQERLARCRERSIDHPIIALLLERQKF